MINNNRRIWMIVLCFFGFFPLSALDVVYINNGDIVLGNLLGPVSDGVSYTIFGEEITIPLSAISATEKNLVLLSEKTVQVVLKDGSEIQGKIVDFDEDLGLFIDIAFGTLTIPIVAIEQIYEKEKRTRYTGAAFQVSAHAGFYTPLADSAEFFGASWHAGAGFDWAIPQVRGLYGGARATIFGMEYLKDSSIKYMMVSLRPEISYKYLGWRMEDSILSKLVPYASLGVGPVYIAIEDPASYPSSYGSITADISIFSGVEYSVLPNVVIKLEGNASVILQSGSPFLNAGAVLTLCYER